MTAVAARSASVYVGGAPVTMLDEPTTDLGAHTVYRITDALKRAIDPATAVTVEVDGGAAPAHVIDYAAGTITFADALVGTEAVTIIAKYVPLLLVATSRSARVARPHAVFADATRLGDTAPRQYEIAKQCSATVEHMTASVDSIGDPPEFVDDRIAGGVVFAVINLGDGRTVRGWFGCGQSAAHDLNSMLMHTLELVGIVRDCVGRTEQALFTEVDT